MTNPSHSSADAEPEKASIAHFFDDMAVERNALFRSNPVLDYEQQVRSQAVLARHLLSLVINMLNCAHKV